MPRKRPVEQYEHTDKQRVNNPPVGLVTAEAEPGQERKTYAYDPHLDPQLNWAGDGAAVRDEAVNWLRSVAHGAADLDAVLRDVELPELVRERLKVLIPRIKADAKRVEKAGDAWLQWAGKAERTSFEIPTVALHVHERIDPRAIMEAVRKKNGKDFEQLSLFNPVKNAPLREAIDFYKHRDGWSNRLIAGDSLLVMNSLIEKEAMVGQVQMIYFDPPYGIRYGSNFQPFVGKREVKDGKDEDLTAEPEMVKAFRDTWELGLHSYLSYLRDRLLLARELLAESGSVFVQISSTKFSSERIS